MSRRHKIEALVIALMVAASYINAIRAVLAGVQP